MRSIALCDDHEVVLRGLEYSVSQLPLVEVTGLCRTADDCLNLLDRQAADLVIVDINFGRDDGVSLARQIKRRWPSTKVLALTCRDDLPTVRAFLATGAEGYVLKDDRVDDLSHAVNQVLHGKTYVSSSLAVDLLRDQHAGGGPEPTEEESEVLRLICRGYLNKQIAGELTLWATAQGWA